MSSKLLEPIKNKVLKMMDFESQYDCKFEAILVTKLSQNNLSTLVNVLLLI